MTDPDLVRGLVEARRAANSILWMAEGYAVAGGSGGPEMRDYQAAEEKIRKAVAASLHITLPVSADDIVAAEG